MVWIGSFGLTVSSIGPVRDHADRGEARDRIERQVRLDRGVGGERRRQQAERVAVGRRLRDQRRADRAAGAGLVLDDHRHLPGVREALAELAREGVVRAARRVRNHDRDRLHGELLLRRRRGRRRTQPAPTTQNPIHSTLPSCAIRPSLLRQREDRLRAAHERGVDHAPVDGVGADALLRRGGARPRPP